MNTINITDRNNTFENRLISPPLFDTSFAQPNVKTEEDFYNELRAERNQLLSETDWTMLLDVPISKEKRQEYVIYRQQLRDLPLNATPHNLTWPTIPS
jgi:hypothetical protein